MQNPYPQINQPLLANDKQQQIFNPPIIQIGKFHDQSNKFDDKYQLSTFDPPYKITAIQVHFSDYIVGIAFKYKCGDGLEIWQKHNMCSGMVSKLFYNVTEKEFTIDDDDSNYYIYYISKKVLLEINGRSGDWLDRIGFVTYKGKNIIFGGSGGQQFIHNYYGYTFGIVSGAHREYIDGLQFQLVPLPDHIVQYFQNYSMQKKSQTQIVLPQYQPNYPLSQSTPLYQQQLSQLPSNYQQQNYQPQSQVPYQQPQSLFPQTYPTQLISNQPQNKPEQNIPQGPINPNYNYPSQ